MVFYIADDTFPRTPPAPKGVPHTREADNTTPRVFHISKRLLISLKSQARSNVGFMARSPLGIVSDVQHTRPSLGTVCGTGTIQMGAVAIAQWTV